MRRSVAAIALLYATAVSAELVHVSDATWKTEASAALGAARPAWESVVIGCVLRIKSTQPAKLGLRNAQPERGDTSAVPRLCRVDVGDGGPPPGDAAAVLALVDSVGYLEAPGNWEAFLNKAAYCKATGRAFYAWVGTLPRETLDARPGGLPWTTCREAPGNTLNIYKAIALLALFHGPDPPKAVLYLDADAWFSDAAFDGAATPERYLALSEGAELLGNQNRVGGPKIPMNGGLLMVRNWPWASEFLALWWRSRCGPHDQLPLWATLFAAWARDTNGRYAVDASLFKDYDGARGAIGALRRDAPAIRDGAHMAGPWDGGDFGDTGILTVPLELPKVLILPSAPVADAAGSLPAVRSDVDETRGTFACHTRPGKRERGDQCAGDAICAGGKCAGFLGDPLARGGFHLGAASVIAVAFAAPFLWALRRRPGLLRSLRTA